MIAIIIQYTLLSDSDLLKIYTMELETKCTLCYDYLSGENALNFPKMNGVLKLFCFFFFASLLASFLRLKLWTLQLFNGVSVLLKFLFSHAVIPLSGCSSGPNSLKKSDPKKAWQIPARVAKNQLWNIWNEASIGMKAPGEWVNCSFWHSPIHCHINEFKGSKCLSWEKASPSLTQLFFETWYMYELWPFLKWLNLHKMAVSHDVRCRSKSHRRDACQKNLPFFYWPEDYKKCTKIKLIEVQWNG